MDFFCVTMAVVVALIQDECQAVTSTSQLFRTNMAGLEYVVGMDLLFPESQAMSVVHVTSKCRCNLHCLNSPGCIAFSAVPSPSNDELDCRLGNVSLTNYTLQNSKGAQFYFQINALPQYQTLKEDFLVYYVKKGQTLPSYKAIAPFCTAMAGGFRFAIFKTYLQLNILKTVFPSGADHPYIGLNLFKSPSGPMFGDNTLFNTSQLGQDPSIIVINDVASVDIFIFTRGQFHDEGKEQQLQFMCQANPFNLDW